MEQRCPVKGGMVWLEIFRTIILTSLVCVFVHAPYDPSKHKTFVFTQRRINVIQMFCVSPKACPNIIYICINLLEAIFLKHTNMNQCWFNAVLASQLNGSSKHDTGGHYTYLKEWTLGATAYLDLINKILSAYRLLARVCAIKTDRRCSLCGVLSLNSV